MNRTILILGTFLCACSNSLAESDSPSTDLLSPLGKPTAAFEEGWGYRARVYGSPGTRASGHIAESSEAIPPVDGQRLAQQFGVETGRFAHSKGILEIG